MAVGKGPGSAFAFMFAGLVFLVGLAGIRYDRVSEPGFMSQETCADMAPGDPRREAVRDPQTGQVTYPGCQNPEDLGMWDYPPAGVGWVLAGIGLVLLGYGVSLLVRRRGDSEPDVSPIDNRARRRGSGGTGLEEPNRDHDTRRER